MKTATTDWLRGSRVCTIQEYILDLKVRVVMSELSCRVWVVSQPVWRVCSRVEKKGMEGRGKQSIGVGNKDNVHRVV